MSFLLQYKAEEMEFMFIFESLLQKGYENATYCCTTVGISLSSHTLSPAVFQEDGVLLKMW